MTIDEEKQQLRATIRRLSAQLPFRYREAADRAIARHLLALEEPGDGGRWPGPPLPGTGRGAGR